MTVPCRTHQSMSVTLVSVCLIIGAIISPSLAMPLRRVGVEKKVTQYVAVNRDLILCWVVQIMTHAKCSCVQDESSSHADGEDEPNNVADSSSSSRHEFGQRSSCICEKEINDHISALSEEVGLHIIHSFGQFHDHFLLCHLNINQSGGRSLHRNPAVISSKSETISWIHKLHLDLKSKDIHLFHKHKAAVEDCLHHHEEVVWFTSEYVHRHHSRSIIRKETDHESFQNYEEEQLPLQQHAAKFNSTLSGSPERLSQNMIHASADSIKSVIKLLLSDSRSVVHSHNQVFLLDNRTQVIQSQNQHMSSASSHYHQDPLQMSFHSLFKRSLDVSFNDPMYPQQWHLDNRLTLDMDVNVTEVWRHNYTGRGVTVAVVDDGLEWKNPDLKANYNYKGSWDMNDNDPDPSPSASKISNHHGTRCAGEIAAVANNHICGVGIAYGAQISGLRVLDGVMTDSMEADAFNMKMDINDIYSCSWGPDDDGRTVDGPHLMAAKAMKHGVDFGRNGYGSIFVLASGNGGENYDNCNYDGYANSIYTVTIGAVDDRGGMPYYAEECASMIGVTFSSGTANKRDIVTTDWTLGKANGCTDSHTGTSAAAPLAAGMIALMLQARPCLTWRDVQYIIILTGQKVDVDVAELQKNGAGLFHSHKHGFGLLNSWRLVNAARVWEMVPWLTSYSYAESDVSLVIPKGKQTSLRVDHFVSEADIRGLSLFILENVQLTLTLSHPFRGKIGVKLTSPMGTVSVLATPRPKDNSTDGFTDWTFTTVRCWGEKPTGNWTFSVTDHDSHQFGEGQVTKWRLTLFGTPMTSEEFAERQRRVEAAMGGDFLDAESPPCVPMTKYDSIPSPLSDRTLKILILSGAFCFIMAVYETFEYIFCYNDEKKEARRNRRLALQEQQLNNGTSGVANSEDHDSSSFLNGGISLTNNNSSGTRSDDDEDDIFDASETSRLIRDVGRSRNIPEFNMGMPEEIPLSVLSANVGRSSGGENFLSSDELANSGDGGVNLPPLNGEMYAHDGRSTEDR